MGAGLTRGPSDIRISCKQVQSTLPRGGLGER